MATTKKLPLFVRCIGAENNICKVGRIYSTPEPVGKYHTNKFWANTLKIFPAEFVEVRFEEYEKQIEEPDTSFDKIEVSKTEAHFHYRKKPKRKYNKKKDSIASPVKPQSSVAPKQKVPAVPKYLKYIEWNVYADFWLGLKKDSVGKIFNTQLDDKTNLYWETTFKLHRECYEPSDKLHWNLSREHSVPVRKAKKENLVAAAAPEISEADLKTSWTMELYNEIQRHGMTRLSYNKFKEYFEKYHVSKLYHKQTP